MRLALALGVALAAVSVSAYAQQNRVVVMHGGPGHMAEIDTNHDGWISRQEASAHADHMFAELDSNNDGKLDDSDRQAHMRDIEMHGPGPGAGPDGPLGEGCTRTVDPPNAAAGQDRRVTIVCNGGGHTENRVFVTRDDDDDADAHDEHGERHIERQVIIRGPEGGPPGAPGMPPMGPMPPMPPMPPHPPMFMMFMSNSDEFDRNHDGALSRDEFRAQQLAFFDASDGNHDGRIRFEPPPAPPIPPTPPEPPQPPQPPR